MTEQEELNQEEAYLSFTKRLTARIGVVAFCMIIIATGILISTLI